MRDLILGHGGLVGSAIHRLLPNAVTFPRSVDLRSHSHVDAMMRSLVGVYGPPDVVYICAAKVGGIKANITKPADSIFDNLAIALNVVEACRKFEAGLVVFLGSSCIYPRVKAGLGEAWDEAELMSGPLEATNAPYATAKLAAIALLEAYNRQHGTRFLVPIPCNLYGPGDNFDENTSHFLPALIRRFYEAKRNGASEVKLWGSGRPRRELLHVDDCARIIVELVQKHATGLINIGPGVDQTILDWARVVAGAAGFEGVISFDQTRPDGVARKLLNVDRMRELGCGPAIPNHAGITDTYNAYSQRGGH